MQASEQEIAKSPSKFEIFKVALDTRNMEIALFWQRSNYFLALNTAIAVGFFTKGAGTPYAIPLTMLGTGVSILWFLVNCGSKFWQSRWEQRLKIAEIDLPEKIDFFAAGWETIKADVKNSLEFSNHHKFRRPFDKLVLWKPSVSFLMILLSTAFIAFWGVLFLVSLCDPSSLSSLPPTHTRF